MLRFGDDVDGTRRGEVHQEFEQDRNPWENNYRRKGQVHTRLAREVIWLSFDMHPQV